MIENRSDIRIAGVKLTASSSREGERGLLGWVSFELNQILRIDGVVLRRTSRGSLSLSFPERRDRRGQCHQIVRPLSNRTRMEIEDQVFQALRLGEAVPR